MNFNLETLGFFGALLLLEIILEIDNLTALREAEKRLPVSPLCKGIFPHMFALLAKLAMAIIFLFFLQIFVACTGPIGHFFIKAAGGFLLLHISASLIRSFIATNGSITARPANSRSNNKTTLAAFVAGDAKLSLDSVVAAVVVATSFHSTIAAMIGAAVVLHICHKPLSAWLNANPRFALIAFMMIGAVGLSIIIGLSGLHIPKTALLCLLAFAVLVEYLAGKLKDAAPKDMKYYGLNSRLKSRFKAAAAALNSGAGCPGSYLDFARPRMQLLATDIGAPSWAVNARRLYLGDTNAGMLQTVGEPIAPKEALSSNDIDDDSNTDQQCTNCGAIAMTSYQACRHCGGYIYLLEGAKSLARLGA